MMTQKIALSQLKSPIAWVGGKSKLTDAIIPLMPEHKCYVEVFAGAAWVLFRKQEVKTEVINDINSDLVCLYRVLQNHLEEFIRYFKWSLISREEFERLKSLERESLTDIQRAARFYYLIKNSFGAKSVNQSFGTAKTMKPRLNLMRIEEDLSVVHQRLARVFIENLHYSEIFKKYDSDNTFFYVDPPYWGCESDYGKDLFFKDDFVKLRDTLSLSKGKWLLSINDVPEIRALFKDFLIKEVQTVYTVNGSKHTQVTELLISNYLA